MQLLTLSALLCLMVSVLSAGSVPRRCKLDILEATGTCSNGVGPTRRFGYNPSSEKCEEFLQSSCKKNANSFSTFKECLQTCNPNSDCLKNPKSALPGLFHTYYIFDINDLMCTKKRTMVWQKTSPGYNRFKTEEECETKCRPRLVEIITNGK